MPSMNSNDDVLYEYLDIDTTRPEQDPKVAEYESRMEHIKKLYDSGAVAGSVVDEHDHYLRRTLGLPDNRDNPVTNPPKTYSVSSHTIPANTYLTTNTHTFAPTTTTGISWKPIDNTNPWTVDFGPIYGPQPNQLPHDYILRRSLDEQTLLYLQTLKNLVQDQNAPIDERTERLLRDLATEIFNLLAQSSKEVDL